ncbi:hypothetical protein BC938DRAFT_479105 [Jimgerdemannia flammicorona]|uniref:Uncharacterized protein n=1 Tax=Jimgerdemannia flammicorona TaxID=994334 RepID=A0A433QLK8_9FUNG|nr:hypothetical protein BC938DRAFT_479105 [Jimgerdemannia flammicorona]
MSFASRILFFFLCLTFAYQLISLLRGTGHRSEPYIPPHRPTTAPNPHGRTSTSRVLNLRLGPPPEIFLGSSTVLAGELLPRTRFGTTADHVHDDELPVVWVGIDGESDIHRLCDLYWAGKLSPLHGVFPRTLHPHSDDERHGVSLLNGRPRPFEALLGDEIQREGNFALCVYDESEISPEVAEAMENAQREALRSGKDAENILSSRKLPTGRYIYTGLHLKVSRTSAIGLHLITSLRPTPNQNPTVAVDRLSSIRSALENRFIAEVHLLQETEDLSVFPEDITKHRKFRYTVVGAPLTYAMAFEYGRRELEGTWWEWGFGGGF